MNNEQISIETYKSLINISIEGIKFCGLINSGGIVEILTYIGSVATKGNLNLINIDSIKCSIISLCIGVLLSGISFILSYLTQLSYFSQLTGNK